MKIITTRKVKLLLFASFLFLVGGSLLNYRTAYATAGKSLVLDQTVKLDPTSHSPYLVDTITDLFKIIPLSNNEYVAIGRSYYDILSSSGLIVKYDDSDNDGNYDVSWYRNYEKAYSSSVNPITDIRDVIQLSDGDILAIADTASNVTSSASYITTILRYDSSGTLLAEKSFSNKKLIGLTELDNGDIIIIDNNKRIYKLSSDFQSLSAIAIGTGGNNQHVFSVGNVYIVDTGTTIDVYDGTNHSAVLKYSINGPFYDVTVSTADNTIVATDTANNDTVFKYRLSDGALVNSITVNEYLSTISVAPNGDIYLPAGSRRSCSYGGGASYSLKLDEDLNILYKHDVRADSTYQMLAIDSGVLVAGNDGRSDEYRKVTVSWYNEEDVDYSTVNYSIVNDDDGSSPDGIIFCGDTTIITGNTFTPKTPTSEGYDFKGWYIDPERTTQYVNGSTVNEDMSLYGKWERKTFTVSFDWASSSERPDGVELPQPLYVKYQDSAELPALPDVTGHTHSYSGNARNVTSDRVVYVNYTKIKYQVTFRRSSASTDNPESYRPTDAFTSQNIAYGDKVNFTEPTANGYAFRGWYIDDSLTQQFDVNTPITSETTIYYGWKNTKLVVTDNPSGGIAIQNAPEDGSAYLDEDGNVVLDGFSGYGVDIQTDQDVTLVIEGQNNISSGGIMGENSDVTITGDGTLTASTLATKELTIDDATVTAGIVVVENLDIKDSDVSAWIIEASGDIDIEDSTVSSLLEGSGGIASQYGDISISNSNITEQLIRAGEGNIIIDGSNVVGETMDTETGGDILIKDSTVAEDTIHTPNGNITVQDSSVTGGELYTDKGDFIIQDSEITGEAIGTNNGNLTIEGSEVNAATGIVALAGGDIYITKDSEVNIGGDSHDGILVGEDASLYSEDSKVNIATTSEGFSVKDISVKNGELNVDVDNGDDGDFVELTGEEGQITLDGGKVNLHSTSGGFKFPVVWVKDGDFSVSSDESATFALFTYVTQIDDGTLNISGAGDVCSMATLFAMFNGGVTNIDTNAYTAAVCVDVIDSLVGTTRELAEYVAETAEERGIELTKGEYIVFNGGYTKLKAQLAAAVVATDNEVEAGSSIKIGKGMVADPENAKQGIGLGTITIDEGDPDKGEAPFYIRTFSNGKKIRMEGEIPVNLSNYVYVHPFVPVPNTDNPNTVDSDILILAGSIFIAVMFQGMVIADLYRRVHGYEEEIKNIK